MAKYPVDYAARLSKAIAGASLALAQEDAEQGPAWRELLSAERAWPLAVLLAFWYLQPAGRQSVYGPAIRALAEDSRSSRPAADFYGIWRYFDTYEALLSRPAQLAYEAKTPSEVAAAGGAFKYAAKKLGVSLLSAALKSPLFLAVSERIRQVIPAPGSESAAQKAGSNQPTERSAQKTMSEPGERSAQKMASPSDEQSAQATASKLGARSAQAINRKPSEVAKRLAAAPAARPSLTATPDLSEQDRCMLLLVSRGHSQKEAEQICQGPARQASRLPSTAKRKKA